MPASPHHLPYLVYILHLHSADWREQDGYLQQWGGQRPSTKTFTCIQGSNPCLITSPPILMFDMSRAQRDSFSTSPNTNSLDSRAQRGHSGGGGNGDRTLYWTAQLNEVNMHTGRSLPVSCEIFFLYFYFILLVPGVTSGQVVSVCHSSDGMFPKCFSG